MQQAIMTKYLGPTNHRGARVRAVTASGISLTTPWKYELGTEANHQLAADALSTKLKWPKRNAVGSTQTGFVFVWSGK